MCVVCLSPLHFLQRWAENPPTTLEKVNLVPLLPFFKLMLGDTGSHGKWGRHMFPNHQGMLKSQVILIS
jgi:hypothetical protein